MRTKTIGVIPARWASTRFPGKSTALICGKPLIQWVIERASRAKFLDRVIVATDDQRIAGAAAKAGADAVMTRADHPSGTDRVAEAAGKFKAEIIVNIQGDEPTIDPELIDELIVVMRAEKKWDMATAASPIAATSDAANPSLCKVVCNAEGQALYFSRHPIPYIRDKTFHAAKGTYWRHMGIYLYRQAFLKRFVAAPPCLLEQAECLEQLRALHLGARIKVVQTTKHAIGVDTPSDIAAAEAALKKIESESE